MQLSPGDLDLHETHQTATEANDQLLEPSSLGSHQATDGLCVTVPCRKSGKQNRIASGTAADLPNLLNSPQNIGGDEDSSIGGSAVSNTTGSSNSNSKLKRGRKLRVPETKLTPTVPMPLLPTNKTSATSVEEQAVIENPATVAVLTAAPGCVGPAAQKKKRGRKTIPDNLNQTPTTASTSDEEEECSAPNCVRPAGKYIF